MWCHCCNKCDIASDDFTRADNTDINTGSAAGWSEDSGSWAISSNTLVCTSAGVVHCTTQHPDGDSSMIVQVTVVHNTSGGRAGIIVGWASSTDYFYASLQVGSGIQIRRVTAGPTDTLVKSAVFTVAANVGYLLGVCVNDDGAISVSVDGTVKLSVAHQSITGAYAGLMCSGSGTATYYGPFRSFRGENDAAPSCAPCGFTGSCLSNQANCCTAFPTSIDVTFPTFLSDVDCAASSVFNGQTFTLTPTHSPAIGINDLYDGYTGPDICTYVSPDFFHDTLHIKYYIQFDWQCAGVSGLCGIRCHLQVANMSAPHTGGQAVVQSWEWGSLTSAGTTPAFRDDCDTASGTLPYLQSSPLGGSWPFGQPFTWSVPLPDISYVCS